MNAVMHIAGIQNAVKISITDTLKKFNIFGSQQKGWLPPSYGKKKYQDMTQEEKSVINEFQGEDDYRYILEHADQFIYDPKSSVPLLTQLS